MKMEFLFLSKEERKKKLKSNVQLIIEKEITKAKEKEILIGIDPETYLGSEILKQSREVIQLRQEVYELKKMTTELISRLDNKLLKDVRR